MGMCVFVHVSVTKATHFFVMECVVQRILCTSSGLNSVKETQISHIKFYLFMEVCVVFRDRFRCCAAQCESCAHPRASNRVKGGAAQSYQNGT